MNHFIDVVLQEARLLHLNINLFIEKKERKEDKNKKHIKNEVTLRSFDKNETLPWGRCIGGTIAECGS